MADLTIAQRFGTRAVFSETTKKLTLDLNDLTDTGDIINGLGLDISGMNNANANTYASKILYALLLLNFQKQPDTNNDETIALYITSGGRRDASRNSIAQFNYIWQVNNYTPNNLASVLDPDQMVV